METEQKKKFWLMRLWSYFTTYEKIWLFSLCTLGVLFACLFPEDDGAFTWLKVVELIVIVGGCSCELLLSKQSKWAFIVSFMLYDLTQIIVYTFNGYYISAFFEIIFWVPILFVSFHFWGKWQDKEKNELTAVKEINLKRDLAIFLSVLALSVTVGLLFLFIDELALKFSDAISSVITAIIPGATAYESGLSSYWYLDALANTFSVCNGLFLVFRFKEQWIPWIGVALVEAIMWILSGQYIMLILSLGYLMNSTYGLIMWQKYIKAHPNEQLEQTVTNETATTKNIENKQNVSSAEEM